MKILLGIFVMSLLAISALGNISSDDEFRLNFLMGGVASEVQLGTMVNRTSNMQTAQFDATGGKKIATYNTGIVLPDNAVVTKVWYDVLTTFASAGDTATVAISSESANDLVTATAINAVGDVWDAGIHAGIPTGAASTFVKMTSNRNVTLTVAVQSLQSGKLQLFVEYVISK